MKTKSYYKLLCKGIALIVVLFFLAGCKCKQEEIINQKWVLLKYGEVSAPIEVMSTSGGLSPGKIKIVLQLNEDNSFNGNDGCNSVFGKYKVKKKCKVKFDSIRTTLMMCQPTTMEQARKISAIFTHCEKFKVEGDNLTLLTPDGRVLIYKKGE